MLFDASLSRPVGDLGIYLHIGDTKVALGVRVSLNYDNFKCRAMENFRKRVISFKWLRFIDYYKYSCCRCYSYNVCATATANLLTVYRTYGTYPRE